MSAGGGCWPEDITTEILSRLREPSSVARSRCVSKSWRRLLSQHDVISETLFPHDNAESQLLIARSSRPPLKRTTSYSIHSYESDDAPGLISSGRFPGSGSLCIAGCTDGVFCLISDGPTRPKIVLWNPTTSETKVLPLPYPLTLRAAGPIRLYGLATLDGARSVRQIGFGFDAITNDYKVLCKVTVFQRHATILYSLRKNSWSYLDNNEGQEDEEELGTRVDDYCYATSRTIDRCHWWLPRGFCYRLTSFDISSEKFTSLVLPAVPGNDEGVDLSIHVAGRDGSCLVAVDCSSSAGSNGEEEGSFFRVWVALDYVAMGNKQCSWIRLYNVRAPNADDHDCLHSTVSFSISRLVELWKRDKVSVRSRMNWTRDRVLKVKYLEFVAFVPSTISLS